MTHDWSERIFRDEGAAGSQVVLDAVSPGRTGPFVLDLNVWLLTIDPMAGTVHVEHSFDPVEGDLTLDQLVEGLRARVDGA